MSSKQDPITVINIHTKEIQTVKTTTNCLLVGSAEICGTLEAKCVDAEFINGVPFDGLAIGSKSKDKTKSKTIETKQLPCLSQICCIVPTEEGLTFETGDVVFKVGFVEGGIRYAVGIAAEPTDTKTGTTKTIVEGCFDFSGTSVILIPNTVYWWNGDKGLVRCPDLVTSPTIMGFAMSPSLLRINIQPPPEVYAH